MEWLIEYNTDFGAAQQHSMNAIAGYSWEVNTLLCVQQIETHNRFAWFKQLRIGSGFTPNRCGSAKNIPTYFILCRAHYSYMSKYMITATLRRDGSSKFGANHK